MDYVQFAIDNKVWIIMILNGLIAARGEEVRCPAPTHARMVHLVRQVERGELRPRPDIVLGWPS